MAREIGDRWAEAGAALNLGTILLDLGELDESRRFLEHSLALAKESGYRAARGDTLMALGRLEATAKRADAAIHYFDDALELARKLNAPSKVALASAYRATLPGGDIEAAEEAREGLEERLASRDRMEVRFVLWKATKRAGHLEEAHRLLDSLCDAAPEPRRKAMMEQVGLFRGIRQAWEERDADAPPAR